MANLMPSEAEMRSRSGQTASTRILPQSGYGFPNGARHRIWRADVAGSQA